MTTLKNAQMEKSKKYSVWPAIVLARCPKCRRGPMFANTMYGFHDQQMNRTCPDCAFRFEMEPGYFYVTMFVSLAMNLTELATLTITVYVLSGTVSLSIFVAILLSTTVVAAQFQIFPGGTFTLVNFWRPL